MQTAEQTDSRTKQLATLVTPDDELEVRMRAARERKSVSLWIHDLVKKELNAQNGEQEPS